MNNKTRQTLLDALDKIANDERINDFQGALQALERLITQVTHDAQLSDAFKRMSTCVNDRHMKYIEAILRKYGKA